MSSISRRRNGLMAFSVIGGSFLGEVQGPSISRQDACFCYSPRPFPCHKLPRERFSPSTLPGHSNSASESTAVDPFRAFGTAPEIETPATPDYPEGYYAGWAGLRSQPEKQNILTQPC